MKTERHCEKNMGVFPKEITIGAKILKCLEKMASGEKQKGTNLFSKPSKQLQ